jgi:hypothetical protein
MIVHQDERMDQETEPLPGRADQLQEMLPILVVAEDRASFNSPGSDMIPPARQINA